MSQRKDKANSSRTKLLIKWFFSPILFLMLWFLLSFIYLDKNLGITLLTYSHSTNEILSKNYPELLAGQKIKGEFVARDNNLGIIAVRFNTYFRINEDTVIFRIKEKNRKNWYYEYHYTTPQFQPNQFFTFGFPVISNSDGKTFNFEIESTKGEHENAVSLSTIEPVFETKYQYSKELILKDIKNHIGINVEGTTASREYGYASKFLIHKILNSLSNIDFLIAWGIYGLPFILYVTWLFFFKKFLYNKYYIAFFPIFAMFVVAAANFTRNDSAVVGFTLLWAVNALVYRLRSNISFMLSISFIILSIILLYSSFPTASKNFTMWGFMLLAVGVIQQIVELRQGDKNLIGLPELREVYLNRKHIAKTGPKL